MSALALPSRAEARCGDFGGFGELLAMAAAIGSGALVGGVSTAVIETTTSRDFSAAISAVASILLGGVAVPPVIAAIAIEADCPTTTSGAWFVIPPLISSSTAFLTTLVAYVLSPELPVTAAIDAGPEGASLSLSLHF